jgi:hypothetical protein
MRISVCNGLSEASSNIMLKSKLKSKVVGLGRNVGCLFYGEFRSRERSTREAQDVRGLVQGRKDTANDLQ